MKKRIIGGVIGIASLMALGLASCSSNYQVGKIETKNLENLKDVVKEYKDYQAEKNKKDTDAEDSFTVKKYNGYDEEKYTSIGYVNNIVEIVENEKGYRGLYSEIEDKFLLAPSYKKELWNACEAVNFIGNNNKTDTNLQLSIIRLNYGQKYTIFDTFGNLIVKDSVDDYWFFQSTYSSVNNAYYLRFRNQTTNKDKYLEYKIKDNGKATVVDEIPVAKDAVTYKAGDTYSQKLSKVKTADNEYTIKYYTGAQNTYYDVYDKDNKLVKTIEVPYGAQNIVGNYFQNGNMILQYKIQLTDDAKDYSYSNNNDNKYKLVSLEGNLFDDSKFKEVNLPYVITKSTQILNKNEEAVYSQVTLRTILDNKTLGPSRYYIMKDDFSLANELEYSIGNLVQTKNGYFDETTNVLYNSDLEVLTYLDDTATSYYKEKLDSFVFAINAKYGVVSSTGKVVVPFEFENISTGYSVGTKVYATNKEGTQGILDVSSGAFTELKGYEKEGNIYYKYDSKTNKTTFVGLAGSETKTGQFDVNTTSNYFGSKIGVQRNDLDPTDPIEAYIITLNDYAFTTIGTETTTEYTLNTTKENATVLTSGDNKDVVLLNSGSAGSYVKLTVAQASKLTIKTYAILNTYILVYVDGVDNPVDDPINFDYKTEKDADGRQICVYTLDSIDAGTYYVHINAVSSYKYIADVNVTLTPSNTAV